MSFCASYTHNGTGYEEKVEEENLDSGNGCWSGTKEELIMEF